MNHSMISQILNYTCSLCLCLMSLHFQSHRCWPTIESGRIAQWTLVWSLQRKPSTTVSGNSFFPLFFHPRPHGFYLIEFTSIVGVAHLLCLRVTEKTFQFYFLYKENHVPFLEKKELLFCLKNKINHSLFCFFLSHQRGDAAGFRHQVGPEEVSALRQVWRGGLWRPHWKQGRLLRQVRVTNQQ